MISPDINRTKEISFEVLVQMGPERYTSSLQNILRFDS